MLDAQTIATVKATIPLLVETGPKLTAHFYDRMFTHNPELKEIFNMSNQRNGDQREALFNAVAAYASNIENLPALLPAVEKIAQKHTSFQIKPEQYNIVGEHLLATLDEMCEQAFDDQCTGANPRYPLISEIKAMYLKAFYGETPAEEKDSAEKGA